MKKITSKEIKMLLRSLVSYTLGGIILLIFLPILMVLLLLPESARFKSKLLYRVLDIIYKGIVWALLMPVSIEGIDNLSQEPVVIVANHQSSLDIPIVGSILNTHPHIWFALIDFIDTPILGYLIRRIGIWVDRSTSISGSRAILQGIRLANEYKAHMIIFPEGGRFADGKVHEFLRGFALLARKAGRPVVPVYMPNNWLIYPPGSFLVGYQKIRIVIGPPFRFESKETAQEFVARVHGWFIAKMKEMQR